MREQGKNIADPAAGQAEVRGGESPEEWTGPLPAREEVQVVTPPGTAVTISPSEEAGAADE
jgi:hypothetical protein